MIYGLQGNEILNVNTFASVSQLVMIAVVLKCGDLCFCIEVMMMMISLYRCYRRNITYCLRQITIIK